MIITFTQFYDDVIINKPEAIQMTFPIDLLGSIYYTSMIHLIGLSRKETHTSPDLTI